MPRSLAERRYLARRRHGLLLYRLPELAAFVIERLHENWTPEQIAGWLKSGAERLRVLSHEAIYAKLSGKAAQETATAIMTIFERLDPCLRRSSTFDNDTAFARHGLLRQAVDLATWFCDAYASWRKCAVENINGRLRRDLPRKIDIDKLSDHDLQDILLMHNLTPGKCLRFKTSAQALLQRLGLDIKISFHRGVALHS